MEFMEYEPPAGLPTWHPFFRKGNQGVETGSATQGPTGSAGSARGGPGTAPPHLSPSLISRRLEEVDGPGKAVGPAGPGQDPGQLSRALQTPCWVGA